MITREMCREIAVATNTARCYNNDGSHDIADALFDAFEAERDGQYDIIEKSVHDRAARLARIDARATMIAAAMAHSCGIGDRAPWSWERVFDFAERGEREFERRCKASLTTEAAK